MTRASSCGAAARTLDASDQDLKKLKDRLDAGKIGGAQAQMAIGRLRQRYQRASRFFLTELVQEQGQPALRRHIDEKARQEGELPDGVYMLKTDPTDLDLQRLWALYMMLSRVESSFRYLKSSLGMRPIFRQYDYRADGHIPRWTPWRRQGSSSPRMTAPLSMTVLP